MDKNNLQPWIGLDSYDEQNSEIFYGRAEEIKEILSNINYNTQNVIYGPSGIGKSSIIKAGIFPKVRENYYLPIYVRLSHNDKTTYTEQVIKITKEELKQHSADIENVLKITDSDENSLWEFFQSNNFWSKDNFPLTPLIVLDQFEEIFTIASNKKSVDSLFEQLSDLTNNYIPKYVRNYISENKIHIRFPDEINYKLIVILREDFLGKLEDYDVKYPSLRKNRYSLQAINEDQAKDIILKPGGDLVDIDVAKKIIQKITNEAEFQFDDIPEITVEPALLSLFCRELNKKRILKKQDKISLELIEESGDDIIKEFYDKEMSKVDDKTVEFLENKLLTKSGFRDSVAYDDALAYGISKEELLTLDKSRIIRTSEHHKLKRIEYTHDILCKVAKENKENRKIKQEKEKDKRNGRIKTVTISLLILFLVASSIFIYLNYFKEYVKYSSLLINQNGFWKGIDELSVDDRAHRTYYYRLSKQGYKGPYTLVEAYDAYGNLTTEHEIVTILLNIWDKEDMGAKADAVEKIKKMCKWRFVKGKDNEIIRQDAFDKNDSLIFSVIYTQKIEVENNSFVYGRFTDDKQLPFVQRKEGIYNFRITHDKAGNPVLFEYFDYDGKPAKNSWNAYAEKREYDEKGLLIKQASLNEYGEYMTDRAGNTGQIFKHDEKGNLTKSTSFGENNEIKSVKDGYAIVRYEYNSYGNMTKLLYFDENDKPCKYDNMYYGYNASYEKGKVIKVVWLEEDGISPMDNYLTTKNKYDNNGKQIAEEYFYSSGHYANPSIGDAKKVSIYKGEKLIDEKKYKYEKEEDTLKLNYHHKVWLDDDNLEILKFWYNRPNYTYKNYFEKLTYNENGEQNSFATFKFEGDYSGLYLNDINFWDNNENRMISVNNQKDGYTSYHKWVDTKDNRDTITVLRAFIDSTNTIIKYKNTKKYREKEISNEYFDANKNLESGTRYSHNIKGDISAISYIGKSGNPYRNPNYRYKAYKLKYALDIKGRLNGYAAYNEYNEKSYARYYDDISKRNIVFHKYDIVKRKDYDLDDEEIEDMEGFRTKLDSLYFIYLKSETNLTKYKLKDGDIIVGYGIWKYDGNNILDFYDEFYRLTDSTKNIILLRLPDEKLIEIDAPADNFKLGYDFFYLTEKEHKRIVDIIK